MKTPIQKSLLLTAILCGQGIAQQVRTAPASTLAAIPEHVQDSPPAEPSDPEEKPDFQIEKTLVKLIDVVESPPMPGLPPVAGTMTIKVHSVADPGIPDPTPAPATPPQNTEFRERIAELAEEHQETHLAFISATVYDRSRTQLICHQGGDKAVTAWSNVDFNHFSGIGTFLATGADGKTRSYHLMMGIGNEDTGQPRELLSEQKIQREIPKMPSLPDGAPAFVIETKDPAPESVRMIEDLHALYRDKKDEMAADADSREQAYENRKAYLLANPPQPKDVTVHFWKRNNSVNPAEGGEP